MEGNKRRYRKRRLEVIEHYGAECACCGERRIQFLAVHHLDGGGIEHRKEIRSQYLNIYNYLVQNDFPDGYGIMCHNCNSSYGFYGYCPHQLERDEITDEDTIRIEYERSLERKLKHARATGKRDTETS